MQALEPVARVCAPTADGGISSQTAFFVAGPENVPVLVTAAHCLTGSRNIPLDSRQWFQPLIVLSRDGAVVIKIQIGDPKSKALLIPRDRDHTKAQDIILLPISAFPELQVLAERAVFHRLSARPPRPGMRVHTLGLADTCGPLRSVPTVVQSEVLGENGWLWIADPPAIHGLSGGPMLTGEGECIGMQTGYVNETDERTVFVAANVIRSCL